MLCFQSEQPSSPILYRIVRVLAWIFCVTVITTFSMTPLEKTKKQLRSVLISEKNGVAAERLERDYMDLASSH